MAAHRPTVAIEKVFKHNLSAEISFVQGEFNNVLLTDHYDYSGYLVRVKKHFGNLELGNATLYGSIYGGTLKRTIQTKAGFLYPSRDFLANSVRGGYSFGFSYFSKSKINIDGMTGLGYGKYTKVYRSNSNQRAGGYLDMQVWLSVGYCL
ncbi:MAG: hypothetical protein INR73_15425 [Williamsia sp.]|nr:hypothetical protein [Williamsia sp.]